MGAGSEETKRSSCCSCGTVEDTELLQIERKGPRPMCFTIWLCGECWPYPTATAKLVPNIDHSLKRFARKVTANVSVSELEEWEEAFNLPPESHLY